MTQEIELKFQIESSSIEPLQAFLNQKCHNASQSQLYLTNNYYDTADHFLRDIKSSIRIRGTHQYNHEDEFEITVKSDGNSVGGLHSRKEINVPLPNDRLDLSVLPKNTFYDDHDLILSKIQSQLIPQFSTHFHRKTWVIDSNQSKIEVAFDQGEIFTEHQKNDIFEIELELKSGSQADLIHFAIELTQFKLHLFSQSKAARGYRLLNSISLKGSQLKDIEVIEPCSSLRLALPIILKFWQSNEEFALENEDRDRYLSELKWISQKLAPLLLIKDMTLIEIYEEWKNEITKMKEIKPFAYSSINTKFKLSLMLLLF